MSWLLSFKGLSLGKGRKNKRSGRAEQDSQGRKRLRPSSSCYNTGSYDLATAAAVEERPNRFSWASSPFDEEYMNNDVAGCPQCCEGQQRPPDGRVKHSVGGSNGSAGSGDSANHYVGGGRESGFQSYAASVSSDSASRISSADSFAGHRDYAGIRARVTSPRPPSVISLLSSSELASPIPHPLPPPLRRDNMVRRSMYNFPPPARNSVATSSVCSSRSSTKGSGLSSRMSDFAGRRASALFMSARSRPRSMQMRPTSTGCESSAVGAAVTPPGPLMTSSPKSPTYCSPPSSFVGRKWLFREIQMNLTQDLPTNGGVILYGAPGTGKTELMKALAGLAPVPASGRDISSRVMACHFADVADESSCIVANFVHGVAKQIIRSRCAGLPYKELLRSRVDLARLLSTECCSLDPARSFLEAVVQPLQQLRNQGRLFEHRHYLVLVDGLCAGEMHKSDKTHTLSSFLAEMAPRLPKWMKLIVTIRTSMREVAFNLLPFSRICLDDSGFDERIRKDVMDFVSNRMAIAQRSGKSIVSTTAWKYEEDPQTAVANYLAQMSRGSFLYCKMVLDLLERELIVVKSPSLSVIPKTAGEIFQLKLNLAYPSATSFAGPRLFLAVCLASLRPLTLDEIFECVKQHELGGSDFMPLSIEEFERCFYTEAMRELMPIDEETATVRFFHGSFRDWLLARRTLNSPTGDRFSVDPTPGHEAIACWLWRKDKLTEHETLDLAHHVLKSHMFSRRQGAGPLSAKEVEAVWIASAACNPTLSIACHKNVATANAVVCRTLLLAGADPNVSILDYSGSGASQRKPLLHVFVERNNELMVNLILEFGGCADAEDGEGRSALMLAAKSNSVDMIRLLLATPAGESLLGHASNDGRSSVSIAAECGSVEALRALLSHEWADEKRRKEAMQDALVSAASKDQHAALRVLLEEGAVDVNASSPMNGQSALAMAIEAGSKACLKALLDDFGADVSLVTHPLHLAIRSGHWNAAEIILGRGRERLAELDDRGLDPLSCAAAHGELAIMELLLGHGAAVNGPAGETPPLSWACGEGREESVVHLLKRPDVDVDARDGARQRTPLHHALGGGGSPSKKRSRARIVRRLVEHGADIEAVDKNGFRPVDRAVESGDIDCVQCLLKKGARLGPTTWALAKRNENVLNTLLHKLLSDGHCLRSRGRLSDAAYRFEYALKRIPAVSSGGGGESKIPPQVEEIKCKLLLALSQTLCEEGKYADAVDRAGMIPPSSACRAEALAVRARAKAEGARDVSGAQADVREAIRLDPENARLHEFSKNLRGLEFPLDNVIEEDIQ